MERNITTFDKLVRDRIPQILDAKGIKVQTRTAEQGELIGYLAKKLVEEGQEFEKSRAPEELADVLEVLYALLEEIGLTREDLEEVRLKKLNERGGFSAKIILEKTEE